MNATNSGFEPVLSFISHSLATVEATFYQLPGSTIVARYVKSSHQNDPWRTLLEVVLFLFAVRTLLQSRTRADSSGKHFIKFSEKEIDELVDEWMPEPIDLPLTEREQHDLNAMPVISGPTGPKPKLVGSNKTVLNMASFNFTDLAGQESIKEKATEALRKYGLGSCGPAGFYGTFDTHTELERNIADFLGTEDAILYSQAYSTVSSVIPAFCKRGDIIVADRSVNFTIQKGLQISRSTIRWFDHNDMQSLEDVLVSVEKERRKRRGPLTRRFIVTEGIFERDGSMADLPRLIELKEKHKFRLILDESFSFGAVGRTGRGLTELYNVPASQVDMLVGSVANSLCSSGGFCAGSEIVVKHQRINGPAFVFSASMPAAMSASASEAISILRNTPSILTTLQENVRAVRSILDRLDCIVIPSHHASPIIHINVRPASASSLLPTAVVSSKPSNPQSVLPRDPPVFDIESEERLLQEVVEDALSQGVLITRAKRLRGQEMSEARPSIRLAVSAGLTKKESEKAATVVKTAIVKVLGKRR